MTKIGPRLATAAAEREDHPWTFEREDTASLPFSIAFTSYSLSSAFLSLSLSLSFVGGGFYSYAPFRRSLPFDSLSPAFVASTFLTSFPGKILLFLCREEKGWLTGSSMSR